MFPRFFVPRGPAGTGRAAVVAQDDIAEAVTNQMLKIEGIQRSETLIAFRAFSRYNMERMFSIGNEEPPPAR